MSFYSIESAIDYLNGLSPQECIDDYKAYYALLYLGENVENTNFDLYVEKNTEELFANILIELYMINTELDFSNYEIKINNSKTDLNRNDQRISVLSFVLYLLNITFQMSVRFAKNFCVQQGLESHLLFLKDDQFLNRAKDALIVDLFGTSCKLIEFMVLNVYVLSKTSEDNLNIWNYFDTVNILLKVAKIEPNTQLDANLAICNIADDNQIETLADVNKIHNFIQRQIHKCAEDFEKDFFERHPRQIIINDQILVVEVHCIEDSGNFSSIIVYLTGLYRLSLNDKFRAEIYFNEDLKNDLKVLLLKGNDIEKKYTLKLYAQLTFNQRISVDILRNKDLIDFLIDLSEKENQDPDVQNLCMQIFWNLDQNKINQEEPNKLQEFSQENAQNYQGEHIMISYNAGSRDLCLKIKSELELCGHKVWIDDGDILSLDSMAKAVEESYCVLVCVTEKYRQSVVSQAEAQYAFKLKKRIVPLIMQDGYEIVKGWLGQIMGDSIFINFTKYDFEECMKKLKNQIEPNIPEELKEEIPENPETTQLSEIEADIEDNDENDENDENNQINNDDEETMQTKLVEDWDENDVTAWFESKDINNLIFKEFNPWNGILLKQLYEMRRDAPEFFYKALKTNGVDFRSSLLFTEYLNNLFEAKNS